MAPTFLPELELYVMLAMARLGDDAYGASILREIEERTGRPLSVGALYATLGRLGEKGLVRFSEEDGDGPRGRGRPRKYCRLTAAGQRALEHSTTMLQRMMEGAIVTPGAGRRGR